MSETEITPEAAAVEYKAACQDWVDWRGCAEKLAKAAPKQIDRQYWTAELIEALEEFKAMKK